MEAITKYFVKKFSSEDPMEAYKRMMKWQARHIINHKDLNHTYLRVEREQEDGITTFKLNLYASISEAESRQSFCNSCQEFHRMFYINSQYNCDRCNMTARMKSIDEKLLVKKHHRKEILKRSIDAEKKE